MNTMNYTWMTIKKFSELTGVAADTIRKSIRAGKSYAKYSLKRDEEAIFINYEAWYTDKNKAWKMAA